MMLYRNTKVKVRSPDADTDYFDIVTGVLQGETFAPNLFIICIDYVLRKKQKITRTNYYGWGQRRWHSATSKYTRGVVLGGARGVVVIAVGNEHGDTSSNPGRDWLHFT